MYKNNRIIRQLLPTEAEMQVVDEVKGDFY